MLRRLRSEVRSLVRQSCQRLSHTGEVPAKDVQPPQLPAFQYRPRPYAGPSAQEVLHKRKQFLGPSIFHYYQKPLNIVEGKMQYLFDEDGRRYLDAFGGIVTVSCGHCHPDVVEAIMNQTQLLQHATTIYLHHAIADYAEALASKMPGNLKVVYLVNSGTEANELAMLMARLYSGNHEMISLRNAYHGGSAGTLGLTALSTWKYSIVQGGVHHVVNPNPYRGVFGSDGEKYAKDVKDILTMELLDVLLALLLKLYRAWGSCELAPGYLPSVYKYVRDAGGVCIADEVQTGFGRTGSHFWGFQTQGVLPDIVTMAKGIGNGLPLGAVVTTPEIANVMTQRIQFNTFGGNPVCSAGGLAVLNVLDKERDKNIVLL